MGHRRLIPAQLKPKKSSTLCGREGSLIFRSPCASQEVGDSEGFIRWGPDARFFEGFARVSEETTG
jgi:hypothetical protein